MHSTGTRTNDAGDLRERYLATRSRTEQLCEPLETEDYCLQPIEDVSPVKWNIAHTSWFFEEMILKDQLDGYSEFDPSFGFLFNSYYNSIGERTLRANRGDLSRPTVRRVFDFRKHVDAGICDLFEIGTSEEVLKLVELGINHEEQHQELLLTDLKYSLSMNPFDPVYDEDFAPVEEKIPQESGWKKIAEGIHKIGYAGNGFCFDNELERHDTFIHDCEIENKLVSNSDFLEFIEHGGYKDPRLWHSDGWEWVSANKISAPLYWRKEPDGSYSNFTLAGRRPLDPISPVCHVSFYEAAAFAEWQGLRLPTEFEWEAGNDGFKWGQRWEWTSSAYLPYPGFAIAEGAVGEYNGKFMVNQKVLRGGSCATTPGHSRATYRNFFHPHLRWQFTGIRLAR